MHIVLRLSFALVLLSACAISASAEAPWCAYGVKGGGVNCGFYSYEQCMATLSGNAGYCARNAWYDSTKDTRRRSR